MPLCAALLISACQPPAEHDDAAWHLRLRQAWVERQENEVRVHSGFDLMLSPDAEQALHQGIPLSLAVDVRIARYRRFWAWLAEEQRHVWRISYLPLSRQYVLTAPDSEHTTYSRLRHLRAALNEEHHFTLHWPDTGGGESARYQVQIRATIDLQNLPSPLRLPALFSRQWRMRSGWQTWLLGTV